MGGEFTNPNQNGISRTVIHAAQSKKAADQPGSQPCALCALGAVFFGRSQVLFYPTRVPHEDQVPKCEDERGDR